MVFIVRLLLWSCYCGIIICAIIFNNFEDSSVHFIKTTAGVGYHITLVKTKDCKVDRLDHTIKQIVPSAKLESNAGAEVSYVLSKDESSRFAGLFDLFEREGAKLGVDSFGASVTTIEEVFIK